MGLRGQGRRRRTGPPSSWRRTTSTAAPPRSSASPPTRTPAPTSARTRPGFRVVPYGDLAALEAAIDDDDGRGAARADPGRGRRGRPAGRLPAGVRELCTRRNVLFIADEIQSGLGRTGNTFAVRARGRRRPTCYLLGKALGGGIVPVSAVVGRPRTCSACSSPGEHGSTFGGNPLACAVGAAVVGLLSTGEYQRAAAELGAHAARAAARPGRPRRDRRARSRGLWAGVDIDPACGTGREVCERLMARGRAGQGHPRLDHPAGAAADHHGRGTPVGSRVSRESPDARSLIPAKGHRE